MRYKTNFIIMSIAATLLAACSHYDDRVYQRQQSYIHGPQLSPTEDIARYYSMEVGTRSPLFYGAETGLIDIRLEHYDYNTFAIVNAWEELIGFAHYETEHRLVVTNTAGQITNYLMWIGGDTFEIIGRDGYVVGQIRISRSGHYEIRNPYISLGWMARPYYGLYYSYDRFDHRHYRTRAYRRAPWGGRYRNRHSDRMNDQPAPEIPTTQGIDARERPQRQREDNEDLGRSPDQFGVPEPTPRREQQQTIPRDNRDISSARRPQVQPRPMAPQPAIQRPRSQTAQPQRAPSPPPRAAVIAPRPAPQRVENESRDEDPPQLLN